MKTMFLMLIMLVSAQILMAQGIRTKVNEGNEKYRQGKYEDALSSYQDALLDDPLNEKALFNKGDALYKLQKYDVAIEAYQKVIGSENLLLSAKALYNIGNVHFQQDKLQESIDSYKKSLELNPNDIEAKYNLELARAKLKEMADKQQQQPNEDQQKQDPIEPSEYAKQLKARAEELVAQKRYGEAHQLMSDGLKQDKTVAAFEQFIQRIKDVVDILG